MPFYINLNIPLTINIKLTACITSKKVSNSNITKFNNLNI
jgi:hypothetical protein